MLNLMKFCYIDPATTAIIWQVIVGFLITFGVILGIWWTKISTFVKGIWVKIFRKGKEGSVSAVKNAVILANGREAETSLIEKQIEQMKEAGIGEIIIVSSGKNEDLESLSQKHSAKIINSPEQGTKNTLASLCLVKDSLGDTYIIDTDKSFGENIFLDADKNSWAACSFRHAENGEFVVEKEEDGFVKKLGTQNDGNEIWVSEGLLHFDAETSKKIKKILGQSTDKDCSLWAFLADNLLKLPNIAIADVSNKTKEAEQEDANI